MAKVHGESKLTFLESTSIIIGHGVGSGMDCNTGILYESAIAFYDCGTVFE